LRHDHINWKLFEMATGAGKTLAIAMLMKRWFQAAVVSRILFLVDRIELAKQAKETFDDYLRDWPAVILYGGKRSLEGQIVVGTLDTIAGQLGSNGFGHAYFDLVVTDECHRSIYNTHRATLGHFDAIHIGLTATPNPGNFAGSANMSADWCATPTSFSIVGTREKRKDALLLNTAFNGRLMTVS